MCERALMFRSLFICLLLLSPLLSCDGARGSNDHGIMQGRYDLSWESPGNSSRDSMPIGNGDFAANVWTEKTSGDVVVLLAKSNSWSEEARLLKLGELRVSLYPRQELGEGSWFSQKLHLSNASISISTRDVKVCVWIHALTNRLEVSVSSQRKTKVRAALRIWRNETRKFRRGEEGGAYGCNCREHVLRPDVIHEDDGDATVLWYHRNGNETCYVQGLALEGIVAAEDPLRYLTSGGSLEGTSSSGSTGISFVKRSAYMLESAVAANEHKVVVTAVTSRAEEVEQWLEEVDGLRRRELSTTEHRRWWKHFWSSSFIDIHEAHEDGKPMGDALAISRAFALERFMMAAGGRGEQPIKFNGGLFTVGSDQFDEDYRQWGGGGFWFQNTRLIYWSMLESGDFELMDPFFLMHNRSLKLHEARSMRWYQHGGVRVPEVAMFWGGYAGETYGCEREDQPVWAVSNPYIRHSTSQGVELLAMQLERLWYFDIPSRAAGEFLEGLILPLLDGVVSFYTRHFQEDREGKLILSPSQCLETLQEAINPLPDVAGLVHVLRELLSLPASLLPASVLTALQGFSSKIPKVMTGRQRSNGQCERSARVTTKETLSCLQETRRPAGEDDTERFLPAELWLDKRENVENPELYPIFPFPLFGRFQPPSQNISHGIAASSFRHRRVSCNVGWCQDIIQASLLGLVNETVAMLVDRVRAPTLRFPGFWLQHFDFTPEVDHGVVAKLALQKMLIQVLAVFPRQSSSPVMFCCRWLSLSHMSSDSPFAVCR